LSPSVLTLLQAMMNNPAAPAVEVTRGQRKGKIMKRITYSIFVGSLALALTAVGAPNDNSDRGKARARKGKAATHVAAAPSGRATVTGRGQMRANRSVTSVPARTRSNVAVNRERTIARSQVATGNRVRARENVAVSRERTLRQNNVVRNRENVAVNRERILRENNTVRVRENVAVNRERNVRTNRLANASINRTRNVTVVNNWRGERFSGSNYAAFRNYRRTWHDRDWWHHHHSHVTFVLGGWWYWDAGYWYPAWGYDRYSYYPYDGPIYTGYATLRPDQVVVNVQAQLQRDGYYPGPIDGDLGPMTRQAIAAFQADHGLAITSTIDEPTLSELGVS